MATSNLTNAEKAWIDIITCTNPPLENVDIESMKGKPITISRKFSLITEYVEPSTDPVEQSRRIATLKFIAIASATHEERMEKCAEVSETLDSIAYNAILSIDDDDFVMELNHIRLCDSDDDNCDDSADEDDTGDEESP